uniref:Uncharacterized protein n=1 Tax=Arundo donax TaxID=35708 RepID=A0A0A9HAY8_ARUDO
MSQISMFLAQSGPMSMSLVARSTMEPAMGGRRRGGNQPAAGGRRQLAGLGSATSSWVELEMSTPPGPNWPRSFPGGRPALFFTFFSSPLSSSLSLSRSPFFCVGRAEIS